MSPANVSVDQRIRGIVFEGTPSPPCGFPWPLESNGQKVGYTTTVEWSPRLKTNLALAMVNKAYWQTGDVLKVQLPGESMREGYVTDLPFSV